MNQPTPVAADFSPLGPDPLGRMGTNDGSLFDLRALILIARRRLDVFLIGFFAVFVLAMAMIVQLTPRYTATAQLLIDTRKKEVLGFDEVLSSLPTTDMAVGSTVVDTEVAILGTEALARTVVSRLQLVDDPEFNATLREPGRMDRWKSAIGGIVGSVAGGGGEDEEAAPAGPSEDAIYDGVVRSVAARMTAQRVGLTYLISISFESENPRTAALVANTYSEAYIERQLEAKFDATRRANDWLSARLGALGAEVEAAERQVEAYREEAGLFEAEGTSLVETRIAEISAQLAQARADLTAQQARLSTVQSQMALGGSLDALGEALASEVIRDLRRQEAEVTRRRAELESELGPRHPTMVSVNRELRDLQAQIETEQRRIVRNLQNEVSIARGRVASLEASRTEAQGELADSGRSLVRLRELERTAEANRALYESFLNRFKQTSEQEGVEEADAQIISEASVPRRPSFPDNTLMGMLALMAAGAAGAMIVALAEMFDSGFRTGEELEEASGLPVVGQVPLLSKREAMVDGKALHPVDYVIARPFSVFAESYRTMKAALVRPRPGGGGLVIVFTSGAPGEGKTVNTAAFARTLALSGTKVVVVDGDLRRRELSRTFDLEPQAGLIEVLSGERELEGAIIEDSSGAHVLPLSPVRYTPQDVFASPAFASMLETLRAHYDVVLFDSAPVMAVADTLSLLKQADIAVVMVRWARSPRRLLRSVMTEMRNVGMRSVSLALTQVNTRANAKYGYGYHDKKYARYYAN